MIEIYEISKRTIVSEVMKIKIDNKYFLNIVLNFDENTLNDKNLNIITLLDNCRQLKNENFTKKRIQETSKIIYMIVDRISTGEPILNNFSLYENIYLDKNTGFFSKESSLNSILYELKFVIFHIYKDKIRGHYVAYSKFKGEWHYFNDLSKGYATKKNPNLLKDFIDKTFPVCIFYVRSEIKNKDLENCQII